jgi:hypothetical protein
LTPDPEPTVEYVFGYGSLVAMREPMRIGGRTYEAVPGRLRGFRRFWGVAMSNLDAAPAKKHYVDPSTRRPPAVRVAFLDVEPAAGETAHGLAVPVDPARLAELDAREVSYVRVEVSRCFEPELPVPVYTYRGRDEARALCRVPPVEPELCISAGYLELVRDAFEALGPESLAELDSTTAPPPFPVRPLDLVFPAGPDAATPR